MRTAGKEKKKRGKKHNALGLLSAFDFCLRTGVLAT